MGELPHSYPADDKRRSSRCLQISRRRPVYTSIALFIAAGCIVAILPFESMGKASL